MDDGKRQQATGKLNVQRSRRGGRGRGGGGKKRRTIEKRRSAQAYTAVPFILLLFSPPCVSQASSLPRASPLSSFPHLPNDPSEMTESALPCLVRVPVPPLMILAPVAPLPKRRAEAERAEASRLKERPPPLPPWLMEDGEDWVGWGCCCCCCERAERNSWVWRSC
jgi:hypothetical protein